MISLARKYRPRRFADLLVQEHVAAALRGAVAKGRVGHGYLLTGPRGVGKTTAARILAMALNCERQDPAHPSGEPCGECSTCQRIWAGVANLDVVEIDAASNRSVDDARDLRERAMYAASQEHGYKVYIVDEAHMLTREAWNALLKILEEPPPRVVFVFATTEPQKIANTAAPVLSRLQRFDFKRIGPGAIRQRLQEVLKAEGLAADDDAIALISRYADGGMRDALSVLDQALSLADGPLTAERVRHALGLIPDESYGAVLDAVVARSPAAIFPIVETLLAAGADLVEFMNGLAELLRALLMSETGIEPEGLTGVQRDAIARARTRLTPADGIRMLGLLTQAETSIRRSANPRLVVETLLLRWTVMDRTIDLEEVLAKASLSSSPSPSPSGPAGAVGGRRPVVAGPRDAGALNQASAPTAPVVAINGPLTVEGLGSIWPDVVLRGKERGHLLGAVLETLQPVTVEGAIVSVGVKPEMAHMREGARRQLLAIEETLLAVVGRPIRVTLADDQKPVDQPRPKRISDKQLRDDKLRELRTQDPTLDAAADALDLEIVE
jgi:DNA polymerase-3 subunit gamma/tau